MTNRTVVLWSPFFSFVLNLYFNRINEARLFVNIENARLRGVEEHIHNCYIFPGGEKDHDDGMINIDLLIVE